MFTSLGFVAWNASKQKVVTRITILALLLYLAVVFISCDSKSPDTKSPTESSSVYSRVLKSGIVRAAYAVYPPLTIKDPKTGEMSGLMVDALNEVGKRLQLKIEWTEEVGWGVIFEGLSSNRYDIFGTGVWRNASRGRVGDFTRPLFYNVIKIYGRGNESRFNSIDDLKSPKVKISTLDGAIDDLIAKSDFPSATRVSLPQLNPWTDVLMNIVSRKADVTFAEPAAVNLFLEKNPGGLKELFPQNPVRVFANCFAIKLGESEFKTMLESAMDEIINDGTLERIIHKYEKHPGEMYRLARPYQLP